MATATALYTGPSDHLDASLEDFESSIGSPGRPIPFELKLSARSAFRAETTDEHSDMCDSEPDSGGGYSPPAWRRLANGDRSSGFWRQPGDCYRGFIRRSGASTPSGYGSDDDDDDANFNFEEVLEQAMRTRLPTGSMSPCKERSPEPEHVLQEMDGIAKTVDTNSVDETVKIKEDAPEETGMSKLAAALPAAKEVTNNYVRFAVKAEMRQRTEPIDALIAFVRSRFGFIARSWTSMALSMLAAILSYALMRSLFQPPSMRPVPDLVKVAGVARSFEPLIYYSENGVQQVGDLQATGVAVWDLGESVRTSNMTSAPIIVKELDELSESLKTLAIELTKFFANVDGDIDGILIVMDWARRELSQLQQLPNAPFSSAFDNIHNMLSNAGILESPTTGKPTRIGTFATSLFGQSTPQRTKQTLSRTFNEFLSVLEEAINNELHHSLTIFALFEAIDNQFLNLARTVVRETSLQQELKDDLLSSLWTRFLGHNASKIQKYERNKQLLQNVRERTVRNKGILVEHNHRLLALKANLESLRRKLVSPLVRSINSSTLTLEDQIRGLEDVGLYLDGVRSRQKSKLMEMMYGSGYGSASARARQDEGLLIGEARQLR